MHSGSNEYVEVPSSGALLNSSWLLSLHTCVAFRRVVSVPSGSGSCALALPLGLFSYRYPPLEALVHSCLALEIYVSLLKEHK